MTGGQKVLVRNSGNMGTWEQLPLKHFRCEDCASISGEALLSDDYDFPDSPTLSPEYLEFILPDHLRRKSGAGALGDVEGEHVSDGVTRVPTK